MESNGKLKSFKNEMKSLLSRNPFKKRNPPN